jgi:WD40 repeat protein
MKNQSLRKMLRMALLGAIAATAIALAATAVIVIRGRSTRTHYFRPVVAFSPSGDQLAASQGDGIIAYWTLGTESRTAEVLRYDGWNADAIAFSPNGKQLAACYAKMNRNSELSVWDLQQHYCFYQGPLFRDRLETLCFSPSGHQIAAASGSGEVLLLEVRDDTVVELWRKPKLGQYLQFLPNSSDLIVIGSVRGISDHIYVVKSDGDMSRCESTLGLHLPSPIWSSAVSSDGKTLAVGSPWDITVVDLPSMNALGSISAITGSIRSVVFVPNTSSLVFLDGTPYETKPVPIRICDLKSMTVTSLQTSQSGYYSVSVAASPDGKMIAVGAADNSVEIIDFASQSSLMRFKDGKEISK